MPTINELNAIPESPVTVYLVDPGDDDPATPDARIHCTQYAAAVINGARTPLARNKGFRVEAAEDDATIVYLPVFVNRLLRDARIRREEEIRAMSAELRA